MPVNGFAEASEKSIREFRHGMQCVSEASQRVAVVARRTVAGQSAPEGPVAQSRSGCAFYVESFQNRDADLNRAKAAASAHQRLNWPSVGERDPWKRSPREALIATLPRRIKT